MTPANATLPCPSPSARRRHAAHGVDCPACDADEEPTAAARIAGLEQRNADLVDALVALTDQVAALTARNTTLAADNTALRRKNTDLRPKLTQVADYAELAQQNRRLTDQLIGVRRALATFVRTPVIRHDAVERLIRTTGRAA